MKLIHEVHGPQGACFTLTLTTNLAGHACLCNAKEQTMHAVLGSALRQLTALVVNQSEDQTGGQKR